MGYLSFLRPCTDFKTRKNISRKKCVKNKKVNAMQNMKEGETKLRY